MAKQFDDDQVAVLQRIIREHERGLSNPSEMFGDYQKPLTYGELAELRKMLHERSVNRAAEMGKDIADRAIRYANNEAAKYASGLLDTFLPPPPPPKTSALLTDAANLISDVARVLGAYPQLMGKDWGLVTTQLRDRARSFKAVGK